MTIKQNILIKIMDARINIAHVERYYKHHKEFWGFSNEEHEKICETLSYIVALSKDIENRLQ